MAWKVGKKDTESLKTAAAIWSTASCCILLAPRKHEMVQVRLRASIGLQRRGSTDPSEREAQAWLMGAVWSIEDCSIASQAWGSCLHDDDNDTIDLMT